MRNRCVFKPIRGGGGGNITHTAPTNPDLAYTVERLKFRCAFENCQCIYCTSSSGTERQVWEWEFSGRKKRKML